MAKTYADPRGCFRDPHGQGGSGVHEGPAVDELRGDARGAGCLAGHHVRTVRRNQAQVAGGLRRLHQAEEPPARLTNAIDAIASSLVANGIVFTRGRSNDQRWAQIDARGFFQSEVDAEPVYLSDSPRDFAQDGAHVMANEVTTPLPAEVTR